MACLFASKAAFPITGIRKPFYSTFRESNNSTNSRMFFCRFIGIRVEHRAALQDLLEDRERFLGIFDQRRNSFHCQRPFDRDFFHGPKVAAGCGLSSICCCLQRLPNQIQPPPQNRSLVPAFEA